MYLFSLLIIKWIRNIIYGVASNFYERPVYIQLY